jgi:hypothetical protein
MRSFTPPLAGAVTWNVVRRPRQPGQESGLMPMYRQSPRRSLINAGSDTAKTRWHARQQPPMPWPWA